MAHKLHAAL